MEYSIDELKLKTASQLDESEKQYLKDNVDKLNDEDKDAYKDFLFDGESVSSETQGADEDSQTSSENNESEESEQREESKTVDTDRQYVFKSEEEAKEFIRNVQHEDEVAKQKAIAEAETPAEKKYVEENWKPVDWNEGIKVVKDVIKQELKEEQELAEKKEVAKRLQQEWETLSKEKNIPPLATKEGRTIHDSIVRFGIATNKQNFTDAFDAWVKIPQELGGGQGTAFDSVVEKQQKKDTLQKQKQAAGRIGGKNEGVQTKPQGTLDAPDYQTLKKARSVNELLRMTGVIND